MSTNIIDSKPGRQEAAQAAFGRRVARRLTDGTADLPHDISERLRAARVQAVARRKSPPQPARRWARASGAAQALGLWLRLASALPVVVLAAGLVGIHMLQNEQRATEVAEVDAALLTDDLPPAAYADPGFAAFLNKERSQ